ncbi:MAG: extracellular solute-binding protein, partial [Paracoccaceae bacterium]|nr:extracellular solute-binding protein [Paracoccaceae bacterium]
AMGKAFEKATGIPTKVVDGSTGPLLARIQAEKQNPQWDIIWVDGAQGMRTLAKEGMLKPYAAKADFNAIGTKLQPKDHAYVVSAASVAGAIVVNTKNVAKADMPTTWDDLMKPAFKGKVGMNNPAISGPTYPMVAGMMQWQGGVKKGEAWFTNLKAHGLHVFDTNDNTLRALGFGQINAAIVQDSAGIGMKAQGKPFEVIYPTPVSLLPRAIAISAKASPEVQKEAEQFIQFLLSTEGQKIALTGDPNGDSDFTPVLNGVAPNADVPRLDAAKTQNVDPMVWGARQAKLTTWFTNSIVH